ncbi:MAG: MFS transporter [Alphaproteobacteria bacterium]
MARSVAPLAWLEAPRRRDFLSFLSARGLVAMATQVQNVAIGWMVYEMTGEAMSLGYVGLALFLPVLACTLPAGDAADRFDRRTVMALSYAAQAAGAAALALLAHSGAGGTAPVYAVLACIGAARALAGPSQQSMVPLLVPRESIGRAIAWTTSAFKVAFVAGPALGGALLVAGPAIAFAVAFAALVLALAAILSVRASGRGEATPGEDGPRWRRLLVGIDHVRRHEVILGAISLDLFAVLLGGATALLPIYARDILAVGPEGLGMMRSAPAVGGTAMAVLLAWRPIERRVGAWILGAVAAFGAATIAFGLSTSFAFSLAALVAMGAADMVSVFVRQTVIQTATPDAMRGRVSSVNLLFVGASNELGDFESGLVAAWAGAMPAVVIGGVGTIAVVGIWSRAFPALRRLDRFADAAPPGPGAPASLSGRRRGL